MIRAKGLNLSTAAEALGVSVANLSKMASRQQAIPIRLVRPLVRLLGATDSEILDIAIPLHETEDARCSTPSPSPPS